MLYAAKTSRCSRFQIITLKHILCNHLAEFNFNYLTCVLYLHLPQQSSAPEANTTSQASTAARKPSAGEASIAARKPSARAQAPAARVQAPAERVQAPAARVQAPTARAQTSTTTAPPKPKSLKHQEPNLLLFLEHLKLLTLVHLQVLCQSQEEGRKGAEQLLQFHLTLISLQVEMSKM
jgi:hypothetical protein